MAYPSTQLSATQQQQLLEVNAVETELGNTLVRAIEACNPTADAARRIDEVLVPMNRGVNAISETLGHDQFRFWIDTTTYIQLTTWTDAVQAALDKSEAELQEAEQQSLRLADLMQSGLSVYENIRVSAFMKTARTTIRDLWGMTKAHQEDVDAIRAVMRSAERSVWL